MGSLIGFRNSCNCRCILCVAFLCFPIFQGYRRTQKESPQGDQAKAVVFIQSFPINRTGLVVYMQYPTSPNSTSRTHTNIEHTRTSLILHREFEDDKLSLPCPLTVTRMQWRSGISLEGVIFAGLEFLIQVRQRGQCPRAGEFAG